MPSPESPWRDRLRDNPYTRLSGWLFIGQWVPMHRARQTFRRAWLLRSFAFRFIVVLAAILFALAYVFTLLVLAARGFAGTGRGGSALMPWILASPLPIGIVYHLAMRTLLRRQFLEVRRADGELICASCGYSTKGLPPNSPCPECGTPT